MAAAGFLLRALAPGHPEEGLTFAERFHPPGPKLSCEPRAPLCYNGLAMAIHIDQVRHIAHLARLELSAEEERRYTEQLSAILDYAARLQEIDTSHISPTATVLELEAPLRPDEPRACLPRKRILANAPRTDKNMFLVPPVLEIEP